MRVAAREKTSAKVARKGEREMSVERADCRPGGVQASASGSHEAGLPPEEGSIAGR
jgi:hypothetical protein